MRQLFTTLVTILLHSNPAAAGWSTGSLIYSEKSSRMPSPRRTTTTLPKSRRCFLQTIVLVPTIVAWTTPPSWAAGVKEPATTDASPAAAAALMSVSSTNVQITLTQPNSRLGIELMDVTIGTPPRTVAAIRSIPLATPSITGALQAGMILSDFNTAAAVTERLLNGPYPVTLVFTNLARGGDAIGDTGAPLVTAQDALKLAQQNSGSASSTGSASGASYSVTTLHRKDSSSCGLKSRRGDVLEIIYEARVLRGAGSMATLNNDTGYVYDSSQQRGTGQPYLMVLGSGDVLPGVDLALYDMCPGDERAIIIPPQLAYGTKGNRLFAIPPQSTLYWKVTLVSVNTVGANDARSRLDVEGRT